MTNETHLYRAVIEGSTYKEFHAYIVAYSHTEASTLITNKLDDNQLDRLRRIERVGDQDRRKKVDWLDKAQVIGIVEIENGS